MVHVSGVNGKETQQPRERRQRKVRPTLSATKQIHPPLHRNSQHTVTCIYIRVCAMTSLFLSSTHI